MVSGHGENHVANFTAAPLPLASLHCAVYSDMLLAIDQQCCTVLDVLQSSTYVAVLYSVS
jgi:hypothetical protein